MPQEAVDLDCLLMDETEAAWLIDIEDKQVWVPKSLSECETKNGGPDAVITIPVWWATREGLV